VEKRHVINIPPELTPAKSSRLIARIVTK